MLKKTQLSEKLKKLKIEGAALERTAPPMPETLKPIEKEPTVKPQTPLPARGNALMIAEAKAKGLELIERKSEVKPQKQGIELQPSPRIAEVTVEKPIIEERPVKKDEPLKPPVAEPILQVKKADEIEEKKPEEIIEPLLHEKRRLAFISDLAIPAQRLSKLFKVETSYTEDTLTQILTAWKDTSKVIKWTAKLDKHGQEFYSLKGEGLMKMKDNPPIYGMEFEDGAVIATHMGEYTFIMGCYSFDVRTLVKIFAFGIENAKRFNL